MSSKAPVNSISFVTFVKIEPSNFSHFDSPDSSLNLYQIALTSESSAASGATVSNNFGKVVSIFNTFEIAFDVFPALSVTERFKILLPSANPPMFAAKASLLSPLG